MATAGRHPIKRVNLNPYAKVMIVCGKRGIGKTKENRRHAKQYLIDNPKLSVLAYDINGDDYEAYELILPKYVRNATSPKARRVVPFWTNGEPMGLEEQKELLYYLFINFWNGLLILDDFDKYGTGAKGQKVVGAIIGCRHNGMDLIIGHQSISKISTTEWENANILRLHHQADPIEKYRDRITNYPLVKIATLIVDEVYFGAQRMFRAGKLTDDNYFKLKGYYVYVDLDNHQIHHCTIKQFDKAVGKFLNLNPSYVREQMMIGDENGRKMSKEEATKAQIKKFREYFGGKS